MPWHDFVSSKSQDDKANSYFSLENPHILEINLKNQRAWGVVGGMIAQYGNIRMVRESPWRQGLKTFLKQKMTPEEVEVMRMEGTGVVYLSRGTRYVQVFSVVNESVCVNGNDLLAFGVGIEWDIKLMRRLSSISAGGFFNVMLEGQGAVAITTQGTPMALRVKEAIPLYTDPHATVAWSGHLSPRLSTHFTVKSLLGKRTEEEYSMKWEGQGWVLLQPKEETRPTTAF
jgi:uncharacterized protein (AIM24 family)